VIHRSNAGLMLMTVGSLLPVGLLQTVAAVNEGTWYTRSAEFMQTPLMQTLRWMRVPGDTLFACGALALGWFMLGLLTGRSIVSATVAPERKFLPESVNWPRPREHCAIPRTPLEWPSEFNLDSLGRFSPSARHSTEFAGQGVRIQAIGITVASV
jgi:hypothetical protein